MRGMTEPEVFVLADRALDRVVAQIPDGAWAMQLPASFATRRIDHTPTLGEIVNYHAYDDAWVPDMLAGRTMEEAGREKFDGDLLGGKRSFAAIVAGACAAAIEVDALDRVVHCSFGDFPARHYFWQITQFRGLRAHDIARVIGAPLTYPRSPSRGSGLRSAPTPSSGERSASSRRPWRWHPTHRCLIACSA